MTTHDKTIETLRAAVEAAPDNAALRSHLAELLLAAGRAEEAEVEFRTALAHAADDDDLKLGLADAYFSQQKYSHALVLVEDFVKRSETPGRAYLLHARILLRQGDVEFAVTEYKHAIQADADLADDDLADRLGIDLGELSKRSDDDQYEAEDEREVVDGRIRQPLAGEFSGSTAEIERPKISFSDVGGMESVKEEIRLKILYPLEHPEVYAAYGKSIGGGILMYGPPGCGKTHLARATAGEIKAGFISVGINDILEMWIGSSERNLHAIFEQARRSAPCVLFFDEVDALGASRSDMRSGAGRQVINQFLSELDGATYSNEGVLILAATNAPWHLDSAFRRPGRFDRILFIPPPDLEARSSILQILCQGKPQHDLDFRWLAKKMPELSGADLQAVVDVAIEAKLGEAMKKGVPTPLTNKDLTNAAKQTRATTKEWFATARNYALYSNQGGLYDDILKYLKLG